MNTATLLHELHNYLEIAEDKKIKAIYVMVEDEIKGSSIEYTPELKAELDRMVDYYLNGGKMVPADQINKRVLSVRKSVNNKCLITIFDPATRSEMAAGNLTLTIQSAIATICTNWYRYQRRL